MCLYPGHGAVIRTAAVKKDTGHAVIGIDLKAALNHVKYRERSEIVIKVVYVIPYINMFGKP